MEENINFNPITNYVEKSNKISERRKTAEDSFPTKEISISTNTILNPSYAKQLLITRIDEMSDNDIYNMLKGIYKWIISDFINDPKFYVALIINNRFLTLLVRALESSELTNEDVRTCNKIVYDYITTDEFKKSELAVATLLSLVKNINRPKINSLIGLGIEESLASMLVLSRYSSDKESINIMRLNHQIIQYIYEVPTQTVIDIYGKLFDRMTDLFTVTMMDIYDKDDLYNISTYAEDNYGNISLAILFILELMQLDDIRKVLLSYTNTYNTQESDIRFSMRAIALSDYPRICSVVSNLELQEMKFVP